MRVKGTAAEGDIPSAVAGRLAPSVPGLTSAFVAVLLLVVAVALASWLRVQQLQKDVQALTEQYVQKVDRVHRMRSLVRERMLRVALVISAEDPTLQDRYQREFRELAERFIEAREDAELLAQTPRDVALLAELRELTATGAPILSELVDVALAGGRNDALARLYAEAMPVQEDVLAQMESVLAAFERDNAEAVEAMARRHERAQQVMLVATALTLMIIIYMGMRVRARIRRDHTALRRELAERQQVEARLRETQSGLEEAVARRTAALQETTERLEEAQRIAGAGYWDWDIRGQRMNWSRHVFDLFGLDPQTDAAGFEAYMRAVHPDDRTRVRRATNAALEHEHFYRVDHRVVRQDGGMRHVRVEGEIDRDGDGRPVQVLGMVRDITRDKASEERLWHQAHHDSLTGLPNRSLLQEHLQQALRRAQRAGTGLALVVCDLDGFKPINDRLGHDAGDLMLVTVARRLREGVRDSDVVARVGGDEFVLLLETVRDPDAVTGVGLKLIERFAEPVEVNREALNVGLSMGAAIWPEDGADADTLLQHADRAMYAAKAEGGSRIVLFRDCDADAAAGAGPRPRGALGCGLAGDPGSERRPPG
ncbi:diguanylate cyclase domain-containing protein [Thioalkalivibrio sp. ALJ16]|uniref:diguanylate cyclase domain-containing protein n=1 Tax=Thioalkalivibrio sp. ALJ16 TaxID=1158762 RepID=UPI00036C7354|nr:diguanylate cyclase [Thioalkalivibrio sp. ALJ16]